MTAIFYISGLVAIVSTLLAITRANAIHGVLNLVVSFLAIAVVLFSIGTPLAAALEVIIYAGAIMVVFIFVVMMLKMDHEATEREKQRLRPGAWLMPGMLSTLLLVEVIWLIGWNASPGNMAPGRSVTEVGLALYGPYVLGVELVSMVLLTGLVAACHLGRRQKGDSL